jgi:2-polyprenyl-6-methoxyphenol hydroxylase-like FAD-dependent oxidoreductase
MTRAKLRAVIIGGSLSGLFAAHLLRRAGWNVNVFERAQGNLEGRGAGLGTQPALFDVMRQIGIPVDQSFGVEVRSRVCVNRAGEVVCEVPLREVSTAWDRIYQSLKAKLPQEHYHAGAVFERFEQDRDKVTAIFANGSRAEGDLLVGADGIKSSVRRQVMPDLVPQYAGYVGWRGVIEETHVPHQYRDAALAKMVFCFSDREMAFTVPMAPRADGTARGDRRCMFAWFRPAHRATELARLCTDTLGHNHEISIPPPLIRPELVDELRADAQALLAPQIAALVTGVTQPILQPIFDLESPRLVFGRVALLGDAAFVARPHVGTGVTKAALDAQGLAEAFALNDGDVQAALARYDRERRMFGNWVVARGRYLGARLEAVPTHDGSGPPSVSSIDAYLREYGAAGVVKGEAISARCG